VTQVERANENFPRTWLGQVAGVDEVGRGPLAGPVTAAAVILDPEHPVVGLRDSKKLSEKARERLAAEIKQSALAWSVAHASIAEIDDLNILQASMLAMQRAVNALSTAPALALIDGNRAPRLDCAAHTIIKGDDRVSCISAASVVAKVTRDALMVEMAKTWPGYGFEQHKGYGTAAHRRKLVELGVTPMHRRSFAPVRQALEQTAQPTSQPTSKKEATGADGRSPQPAI